MRKKPRRPAKTTVAIDREELTLTEAEAEQPDPQRPDEWFAMPWRSGRNAVELALELCALGMPVPDPVLPRLVQRLINVLNVPPMNQDAVMIARRLVDVYLAELDTFARMQTAFDGRLLSPIIDAVRAFATPIGFDGVEFNNIFFRWWNVYESAGINAAPAVHRWRRKDAVMAITDERQQLKARQLFDTAWQSGLFQSAYAQAEKAK